MLVIAAVLSFAFSFVWYRFVRYYAVACVGSTITGMYGTWLVSSSHFGWMDATFFRNLVGSFVISASAAVIVGTFYQWRRERQK